MLFKYRVNKIWQSSTKKVMILTCFGMMFGFLMDLLLAARLGVNEATDAYIVAISLPILIDTVTREGTQSSMTPLLVEQKANLQPDEFHNFTSRLFNLGIAIGIFLTLVIEILAPLIVMFIAPGLSAGGKAEALSILRLCAPLILFTPCITVMSVLLNSQKRFGMVALRNAIAPATVVLFMLLAWRQTNTTSWMALGYLTGFAFFFTILFVEVRKTGFRHQWTQWISRDDLKTIYQAVSLPTLGFVLRQSLRLIERSLASIAAVGGVASYYFALRIFSAIQTLIGSSIATTGLPTITEYILAGQKYKLITFLRRKITKIFLVTFPIVLTVLFFNKPLVALVYGRGVFDGNAVEQTAQVFLWLGLGLSIDCIIPILQSTLYANKRYELVFNNMVISTIANVALAYILANLIGLIGLAIAVLISNIITIVNLIYLNRKVLKAH
ncbi:hypothetical protein I4641_05590 [Waterburya agarophytonicola K14]|uniref:Polysaccharide biosynthesis protein C-terminal domain-containing protein n=1 Tax=Waterburya agarophytonicola KI4 TaxID=2874699 RepID=A0A964BRF3_9CYAN|nr:lipid II flippase MurJ [Waterburya agarophytonicola]MCC0176450.1 hypothetical protein [Waterburya agarophytonicola KI4]